jgi:hypothetical protein
MLRLIGIGMNLLVQSWQRRKRDRENERADQTEGDRLSLHSDAKHHRPATACN